MPDTTGLGISALVVSNLYPQSTELGQQTILEVADSGTDYTVDLTQAMLPRYITAPAYDAASRTIGWGEAPASVDGNLVRARIHAVRDDVASGRSWTWQIVGAKSATSITFPELPALDGFSYVPLATDTVGVDELTTASIPGGYSGVRAHAFGDLNALATSGRSAIETPVHAEPLDLVAARRAVQRSASHEEARRRAARAFGLQPGVRHQGHREAARRRRSRGSSVT